MPYEPLKPEDINLVNRLIQAHPDLRETISIVKMVNAKAKYPVTSFDDLANALGGEQGSITFRGRTITMAEARSIIPAYYFPIASEADLSAKMADMAKALPPLTTTVTAAQSTLEAAIRLMTPSAVKPTHGVPEIAHEEILRISGFGKSKPGTGGLSE